MTVDGASNVNGAGAGIVLVSPEGTVHESVVSIGYRATNNEAEYEALIAGLQLALQLDADSVHVFCDSKLIVGHLNDDYKARDERLASVYRASGSRTIVFDEVETPSFEPSVASVAAISFRQSQLDPIVLYLQTQTLPSDRKEAHKVRCRAANYFLDPNGHIYRRTFTGPDLKVVYET
ncbi:hypothetical protein RHSIM_Rhsim07G0192700 [Rhododendron simsii]|uniref:RNase H type-1 domain-containing protein n=1 Tax=Rhododendron simsii TaxID=118357 RepID=A0A834GRG6_RHOSS|nr:hypothetical protein RHSIM_Rhsim07G0192700 [Rhododendron simsii]